MSPFLTARWSNLALLTYPVNPAVLQPRCPPGCQLDIRDGSAFVSLVAFDFLATRVKGIRWPGYINFPEINLRFYVRCQDQRGVCFIREFVPRRLIANLARLIYNEPYRHALMTSKTVQQPDSISIEHHLAWRGTSNRLRVEASKPAIRPEQSSIEHFFKEHKWGFGASRRGRLLRYRVEHPIWEIYPVKSWQLDWNWETVYGPEWGFLAAQKPISVIIAAGSQISVFPKSPPIHSPEPADEPASPRT